MAQSTFPKPVDQEIKDLNGKIETVTTLPSRPSYNTLSDLKTGILGIVSNMEVAQTKTLYINTGNSFDDSRFVSGRRYSGMISKFTDVQFVANLQSREGDSVQIGYYDGTWNIVSLNSKIAKDLVTPTRHDLNYVYGDYWPGTTGSQSTVLLNKIANFINSLTLTNTTVIDVVLEASGRIYVRGCVYKEKNYGQFLAMELGGYAYIVTIVNGVYSQKQM